MKPITQNPLRRLKSINCQQFTEGTSRKPNFLFYVIVKGVRLSSNKILIHQVYDKKLNFAHLHLFI